MTNETQPFDQDLYDAILKEAGYQHDHECNAPATMFSLGIEAAADIAARLAAAQQPAPVVGDEELERIFWDGYYKFRHENMADDPEPQMERLALGGICAVRDAILAAQAVQVPVIPAWVRTWDTVRDPSGGFTVYTNSECNGETFDTWGYHPSDPVLALQEAINERAKGDS